MMPKIINLAHKVNDQHKIRVINNVMLAGTPIFPILLLLFHNNNSSQRRLYSKNKIEVSWHLVDMIGKQKVKTERCLFKGVEVQDLEK